MLAAMALTGLVRGENGLQVYTMGEIPANAILAASNHPETAGEWPGPPG